MQTKLIPAQVHEPVRAAQEIKYTKSTGKFTNQINMNSKDKINLMENAKPRLIPAQVKHRENFLIVQHYTIKTSDKHHLDYDDTIASVLRISLMMNPLVP